MGGRWGAGVVVLVVVMGRRARWLGAHTCCDEPTRGGAGRGGVMPACMGLQAAG